MGLANISIVGNVVRPPAQTQFNTGSIKTTIVVAVDSPKKGDAANDQTEFYKVEAWGKLGEIAHRYISKGQQITAIGRFNIDRWQDKEGRERYTPTINASQISLPPKRAWDDTSSTTTNQSSSSASPANSSSQDFHLSEEEEDAATAAMFGPSTVIQPSSNHLAPAHGAFVPTSTTPPPNPPQSNFAPPNTARPMESDLSGGSPIAGTSFMDDGDDLQDILAALS